MPSLYSSDFVVKILLREGFTSVSQKGSHAKYTKNAEETERVVIVPVGRREIPRGTFRSILRQSGLLKESFKKK